MVGTHIGSNVTIYYPNQPDNQMRSLKFEFTSKLDLLCSHRKHRKAIQRNIVLYGSYIFTGSYRRREPSVHFMAILKQLLSGHQQPEVRSIMQQMCLCITTSNLEVFLELSKRVPRENCRQC